MFIFIYKKFSQKLGNRTTARTICLVLVFQQMVLVFQQRKYLIGTQEVPKGRFGCTI